MSPQDRKLLMEINERLKKVENYTTNLGGSLEFKNLIRQYVEGDLQSNNKGATSESQAVNEAGSASYNVLKEPDGFDVGKIDNVKHYYPYYL